MKKIIIGLLALSSTSAFAENCSIRPILKYSEQGSVTIPMNVSWIGATTSMQRASFTECLAEGQKQKSYIEVEPEAIDLVSSLEVSFGSGKSLVSESIDITNIRATTVRQIR